MASVMQWFLFGMFVWACCLVMSALESRVSASGQARKARRDEQSDGRAASQRHSQRRRHSWWRSLLEDDEEDDESNRSNKRERAMAAEIVELKDRIATLEAIVTDRKFQWEEELNKPN